MVLKESAENYLETILMLNEKNQKVRSIDIVNELGFSKPSVSRAMKLLREGSYINMDDEGFITLTEHGLEIAKKMYERHNVLRDILVFLGVDAEVALEDACRIEHCLSAETFERLKDYFADKMQ